MDNNHSRIIDDNYLIQGMLNNDIVAYSAAVKQFQKSMHRLAAAIVGNADAEDVVQNAWIQIIKALPKFERRSALKSWILSIVANGAKTQLKKNKRSIVFTDLTKNDDVNFMDMSLNKNTTNSKWDLSTPEAVLESKELNKLIEKSISSLRPTQQTIIKLREYEGLSIKAISKVVGMTETNTRVILHRARLHIHAAIAQYQLANITENTANENYSLVAV